MHWLACWALVTVLTPALAPSDAAQLERNKLIARRVFAEILSQGRFEVAAELYAPDFVNHGETRDYDLAADQAAARGWREAAPDLVMTSDKVIAEGDLVVVLWTGRGTNTGTGNGFPATGKKIQARGITIWRIVDGRIREEWSAYDRLRMMQEAGLLPIPK